MAIAYDSTLNNYYSGTPVSSKTFSTTASLTIVSNDNGLLIIGICNTSSRNVSSVTWNAVALTALTNGSRLQGTTRISTFGLLTPDTGNRNIVVTLDGTSADIEHNSIAYTGVNQTGINNAATNPSTVNGVQTSGGNLVLTVDTTGVDNCWSFTMARDLSAGPPNEAGNILQRPGTPQLCNYGDSNGVITPGGSFSQTWTRTGSCFGVAVSFAPVSVAATGSKALTLLGVG